MTPKIIFKNKLHLTKRNMVSVDDWSALFQSSKIYSRQARMAEPAGGPRGWRQRKLEVLGV